ncbi:hypothetical protein [Streptomyces sp. NPDC001508]|uniref:hypothetical protein n=1 Tax=Streptomyces sp. NPDC001508 TaxID=3154656 RepID=UPI00331C0699
MTADDTTPGPLVETAGQRSIAAERIGVAATGDVVVPVEAPLYGPERVSAAPGTSKLPPTALCPMREDKLAWPRRVLTSRREGAITQSGTVHGLGDTGKTTLALP